MLNFENFPYEVCPQWFRGAGMFACLIISLVAAHSLGREAFDRHEFAQQDIDRAFFEIPHPPATPKVFASDPRLADVLGNPQLRQMPELLKANGESMKTTESLSSLQFIARAMKLSSNWWCAVDSEGVRRDHNFFFQASELLRKMTPKQAADYEVMSGGEALGAYQRVSVRGSNRELYEVAKHFRFTSGGRKALRMLIMRHAGRGDFGLAAAYCEAAIRDQTQEDGRPSAALDSSFLFSCALYAGRTPYGNLQKRMIEELKQRNKPLTVAGSVLPPHQIEDFLSRSGGTTMVRQVNWLSADNNKTRDEYLDALTFLGDRKVFFEILGWDGRPLSGSICDFIDLPNRLEEGSIFSAWVALDQIQRAYVDRSGAGLLDHVPAWEVLDHVNVQRPPVERRKMWDWGGMLAVLRNPELSEALTEELAHGSRPLELIRQLDFLPNDRAAFRNFTLGVLTALYKKSEKDRSEILHKIVHLPRPLGFVTANLQGVDRAELIQDLDRYLDSHDKTVLLNAAQLIPQGDFRSLSLFEKALGRVEIAGVGRLGVMHLAKITEAPQEAAILGRVLAKVIEGPHPSFGFDVAREALVKTPALAEALFQFEKKGPQVDARSVDAAWRSLGELGVQTLVRHLKHPADRKFAARRIFYLTLDANRPGTLTESIEGLVHYLQSDPADDSDTAAFVALGVLGEMAEKQNEKERANLAASVLADKMKSEKPLVRLKAMQATCGNWKNPPAALNEQMTALANDPSPIVRMGVARELARFTPSIAQEMSQSLLMDPVPAIRELATRYQDTQNE